MSDAHSKDKRQTDQQSSGVRPAQAWVVVYDPHPRARAALVGLLLEAGFSVKECERPEEVLDAARSGRSMHFLLTDVQTGCRLGDSVRQHQPDVRILLMSGGEALPQGVVGEFVKKPIDFDALERRLLGSLDDRIRGAG
jgi:DNA-binding NtrC family response regulator